MCVCLVCGKENQADARFCSGCGGMLGARTGRLMAQTLLGGGRYTIVKLVGQGGMGAVYQARDLQEAGRIVAVKEMSQSGLVGQELQEAIGAFAREAEMLARLDHISLPHIYQHFEEEGRWYLVMDFIEGETLEHYEEEYRKKGQRIPLESVLDIGIQLCDVMEYLHSQRPAIIFRDLKPANCMFTPQGRIYLIDFGIARLLKPNQMHDTLALGSPGYAPPEQYQRATTPKSDIYSLGAMLHQFLTGDDPERNPFRFKPFSTHMPLLEDLVMRMVDVDEEYRPADMRSVRRILERGRQVLPGRRRGGQPATMSTVATMRPVTVEVFLSHSVGDWQVWNILQSQLATLLSGLPNVHVYVHGVYVEKGNAVGMHAGGGVDLTLLMLSEDFLHMQTCMVEAKRAIERARDHDEKIFSLLLRSCAWQGTALAVVPMMVVDPIVHASLYAQEQRILEVARKIVGHIMGVMLTDRQTGSMNLLQWVLLQLHKNGEVDCPYFVHRQYVVKNVRRSGQIGALFHLVDLRTSRAVTDFVVESHTSARLVDLLRIIATAGTNPLEVYGVAMHEQPAMLKTKIAWL